jgi:hypothetical protein
VALSPCAAGGSGGRERAVCFQPAGWARRVLSACRRGAHGAFDAAITRGDATRHMLRSRRQPARASLRSALVGAVRGLCAPRSWTQSGACALRARGRRQAPVRSTRRGRRRNLVRPRRRSAAKPERLIDGFAGRAVWHYPPAQQGVVAAANAQCAFSLQAGRTLCFQPAGVAHTVLLACRRGAHGASSLQAWRTRCFQPAGWAHTVPLACRLGAHGASSLQAGRTRCVRGRHHQR